MPRRPRVTIPNVPLHVIQRGNNRQACFIADEDYCFYLDWLKEYASKAGCLIHAYALMTNHVHLLLSSATGDGVGMLMKSLGQRYVQYVNRTYRRSGTLWEGRFRSCLTQEEPESGIALSEECIEEAIQIEELPEDDNFIYVKRLGAFQYEQVA